MSEYFPRGHPSYCPLGSLGPEFFTPLLLVYTHSSLKAESLLLLRLPPQDCALLPMWLSWTPLQLSIAQSSFCSVNLLTFWSHQLPSPFSTWLWTLWMLKWDYAFYLCAPRLGSNEWVHWKSVSQKDGRTFLCQCSSKSKAHFYQSQMSWLLKMQTSGLCLFCFMESGDGTLNLHLKRAFPHLILISITQSWEPLSCKCWVLAEINTEASHAQISRGVLFKFLCLLTALPHFPSSQV